MEELEELHCSVVRQENDSEAEGTCMQLSRRWSRTPSYGVHLT